MEFWRESDSKYKASDLFVKGTYGNIGASYYRHADSLDGFHEPLAEPGLPPGSAFKSAEDIEQTIDILTLKYHRAPENARISVSADFSYSHRDGMHCAGCHAAQEKPEYAERADHGYQAIADLRVGLKLLRNHDFLVGVEGRRRRQTFQPDSRLEHLIPRDHRLHHSNGSRICRPAER